VFDCTYDPAADKWGKFPTNGLTHTSYHNESDLNSYQVCSISARRYNTGKFHKGLTGVRTGRLSINLNLVCLDFDKQRQPSGEWNDCVKNAARHFNCYTEESVSGTGCHIFVLCERPYREDVGKCDHQFGEVYWANQSIALTGKLVSFGDWKSPEYVRVVATAELFAWLDEFQTHKTITHKADQKSEPKKPKDILPQVFTESDASVLEHLFTEKDSEKIIHLFEVDKGSFENRSLAIGYLACRLAFHSGRNIEQIKRLIKLSAVWNSYQPRRSDNWLKATVENACCVVKATRKPKLGNKAQEMYRSFLRSRKEKKFSGEQK
jgi:hypothetical protein